MYQKIGRGLRRESGGYQHFCVVCYEFHGGPLCQETYNGLAMALGLEAAEETVDIIRSRHPRKFAYDIRR